MGGAAAKTMIMELNGLTGCGKSTVSRALIRQLKQKYPGLMVSVPRPQKGVTYILSDRNVRRMAVLFIRLYFQMAPLSLQRCKWVAAAFRRWLGIYLLTDSGGRRPRICVLEDGVIVSFLSIAYPGRIRNQKKWVKFTKEITCSMSECIFVNCVGDADTSAMRILQRATNGSRLDQISDIRTLTAILKNWQKRLTLIRKSLPPQQCISLDMMKPVSENVEILVSYVDTVLNNNR